MCYTIKGICYLDDTQHFRFTGYATKPTAEELEYPDYDILEKDGSIEYFIPDQIDGRLDGFSRAQSGGRLATVAMTKGCVARCTFCHRWVKSYRNYPIEHVTDFMKHMISTYKVGFFSIADESFGVNAINHRFS